MWCMECSGQWKVRGERYLKAMHRMGGRWCWKVVKYTIGGGDGRQRCWSVVHPIRL